MADKGKKDKGKRETKKKAKLTLKEKRKQKREKRQNQSLIILALMGCRSDPKRSEGEGLSKNERIAKFPDGLIVDLPHL